MKYCQSCGRRADDSDIVCPDPQCRGHLDLHPPVQTPTTAYDIEAISKQVWSRLWKKHIYFITGEFSILMLIGLLGLVEVYHQVTKSVATKIDGEFKTERIRATVSEVASNQAGAMVTRQIQPEVDKFETQVAKQLSQVTDTTTNAVAAIKQLQGQSEFLSVLLKADNDDRKAFDQLTAWAADTNYPFQELSMDAVNKIEEGDVVKIQGITKSLIWNSDVVVSNLPFSAYPMNYQYLSQMRDRVDATSRSSLRVKLMYELNGRNDFPKNDKMQFLMDVYKHDKSLNVVSYVGRIMNKEPGCDYLPLDTPSIISWWERNKTNYQTISTNSISKS